MQIRYIQKRTLITCPLFMYKFQRDREYRKKGEVHGGEFQGDRQLSDGKNACGN